MLLRRLAFGIHVSDDTAAHLMNEAEEIIRPYIKKKAFFSMLVVVASGYGYIALSLFVGLGRAFTSLLPRLASFDSPTAGSRPS